MKMAKDLVKWFFLIGLVLPLTAANQVGTGGNVHRRIDHTKAYKKRTDIGPHVNIKITPPEKRGKQGRVLVEVYNFSATYLSSVSFELILKNSWGDRIEARVSADDLKQNWSGLVWIQIPGSGKIEKITGVEIANFQAFNKEAKPVSVKFATDLIKE
jgi:hypothetical protein